MSILLHQEIGTILLNEIITTPDFTNQSDEANSYYSETLLV